jgi:cell division protein FtsN
MRWVALLLVLANLGLFGWQWAGTPGWSPPRVEPPPQIGELELLAEAPPPPQEASVATSRPAACYTIGPFSDPANAETAATRLTELGVEPDQRSTSEQVATGYRVMLPPYPSTEAALEAARDLARRGVEDYYVVVSESDIRNAVSLGLFEESASAEQHRAAIAELGFDPEIRARTRQRTRYWQDFRDPAGRVTPEVLESLTSEQPLQRLERPCEAGE